MKSSLKSLLASVREYGAFLDAISPSVAFTKGASDKGVASSSVLFDKLGTNNNPSVALASFRSDRRSIRFLAFFVEREAKEVHEGSIAGETGRGQLKGGEIITLCPLGTAENG